MSSRETLRAKAPLVTAIDTTGAGDVFCGTLVAARAKGKLWGEALFVAARAAAICVTREGVLASFPTREELSAVFQRGLVAEPGA